jgi:hypothetical protein
MPLTPRPPLSLLDLPGELQAQIERAARRNRRTAIEELAARVQSTFESSTPETLGTLSLEHELAELSLQSYNLTMELQILQVHFKHAELDTEKQRLAILIDEMASRIGRLEAKRISTLHKAASLQV